MEFLVPFMPMFATLPLAVGGAWIVHRILRHRERQQGTSAQLEEMSDRIAELQERLDVTERMVAQVRDEQRRLPGPS